MSNISRKDVSRDELTYPAPSPTQQRSSFDSAGNSFVNWNFYASALLEAGAAVRKKLTVFRRRLFRRRVEPELAHYDSQAYVYLLLQGLAIECLLKAKWVHDGGLLAENGRYLGIKGAGDHNLRQIAEQCQHRFREKQRNWQDRKYRFSSDNQYEDNYSDKRQLVFSDRQLNLLDQLSHYIMWAGRYPVPKKFDTLSPSNKAKVRGGVSAQEIQDIDEVIKIIERTMAPVGWNVEKRKWDF